MDSAVGLRFFVDHCVPESVPRMLIDRGYATLRLREQLASNAPDPLVAAVAELNGAILISSDADFRVLAPRAGIGRRKFQRLSRIDLSARRPSPPLGWRPPCR